jgi:chemotaxis protein MotA
VDITSILGILLGIAAVIGGQILEGGSISSIIQPTAFIIVFGGTAGGVILSFPLKDLISSVKNLKTVFLNPKAATGEIIDLLVSLALKARKEGILALQTDIKDIEDEFLRKGMELMTDGTDPTLLREIMETELSFLEEEIQQSSKVWESAGGYAPTVGILGAVLGLIHVMENLSDPTKLGSGIAVAFVATVYGVGSANLIFIPLANKIKFKQRQLVILREMMIEGVLSIQAGESPNFIRQKLQVFDTTGASAEAAEE